ncbi:MAG: chemotaxis protein CheW [Pseudanabaenales cyanobacterium]|nr:chemotaxis protein CheW [Pseudanabaenales cyanobacterium]
MIDEHQCCTFFLDTLFFGVEVETVQEIIRYQAMTPVPLAPPEVGGLINLRGQIVTAIDLRRRLALPPYRADQEPYNVVTRIDDDIVSLLVDEVGDVLDVNEADFEPPPETLTGSMRHLIRGAYKLEDRLLLLLDVEKVVDLIS